MNLSSALAALLGDELLTRHSLHELHLPGDKHVIMQVDLYGESYQLTTKLINASEETKVSASSCRATVFNHDVLAIQKLIWSDAFTELNHLERYWLRRLRDETPEGFHFWNKDLEKQVDSNPLVFMANTATNYGVDHDQMQSIMAVQCLPENMRLERLDCYIHETYLDSNSKDERPFYVLYTLTK